MGVGARDKALFNESRDQQEPQIPEWFSNVLDPYWFSNLFRTYSPNLEKGQRDPRIKGEIERARREWDRKVRKLWKDFSRAFPACRENQFSELIHCCWLYGNALNALKWRAKYGTSKEKKERQRTLAQLDKEYRRLARGYADKARALANSITELRNNLILSEPNFNATLRAVYLLIADAFVSPDEQGNRREEFPSLTADLNRLADRIQACLRSRLEPGKPLETTTVNSRRMALNALRGSEKYGLAGMIPLATDSSGKVHRQLLADLVNLIHPELSLRGEDIRREDLRLSRRPESQP